MATTPSGSFSTNPTATTGTPVVSGQQAINAATTKGTGLAPSLTGLTASSNLAAAPQISDIENLVNSLNEAQQQTLNTSSLPGGAALQQSAVNDTSAELAGNLSPGTVSTIEDQMAQQYGNQGFAPDSAAISAAAERAMGLTAEQQVQAGQQNLQTNLAEYPSAPLYGAQNFLTTPGQYSSTALSQAGLLANPGSTPGSGSTGGAAASGGLPPTSPITGAPSDPYAGGGGPSPATGGTGITAGGTGITAGGDAPAGTSVGSSPTGGALISQGNGTAVDSQGTVYTLDTHGNWAVDTTYTSQPNTGGTGLSQGELDQLLGLAPQQSGDVTSGDTGGYTGDYGGDSGGD